MSETEKLNLCSGCRNDFYNDKNDLGVKRCWHFEDATIVERYKVGWWVAPPSGPRVTTLSCWNAPGQFAMYKEQPPGNR